MSSLFKFLSHTHRTLSEALAAARTISFALELGFSSFMLEGDSEVVIRSLKSDDASLFPFGHILNSVKEKTGPAAAFLSLGFAGLVILLLTT
ncbi:hypothetical protein SO802_034688 [Lithocarpus litseifolius]|uniref:RNase H type-1 domain-containing protein n=1 Tax=Lithocarpus litseifolius TaxID=425828 RepID=A0AAW2BHV0_9ROSI